MAAVLVGGGAWGDGGRGSEGGVRSRSDEMVRGHSRSVGGVGCGGWGVDCRLMRNGAGFQSGRDCFMDAIERRWPSHLSNGHAEGTVCADITEAD